MPLEKFLKYESVEKALEAECLYAHQYIDDLSEEDAKKAIKEWVNPPPLASLKRGLLMFKCKAVRQTNTDVRKIAELPSAESVEQTVTTVLQLLKQITWQDLELRSPAKARYWSFYYNSDR